MRRGVAASGEPPAQPWAPDEEGGRDFALIADAAPVPMWTTRPDGSRGFVNRAYRELLGLDGPAALVLDWRDILHPDDAARVAAETAAGVATRRTFAIEGRFRRADGEWRWLRAVSRPRPGPDGEPLGYVGVAHDITLAKVAERTLRAREQQLAFLDALGRATAAAVDADQVLAITTRMLGEQLRVQACAYADVEADGDRFHTRGDWHVAPLPSLVGSYRVADFGTDAVAALSSGKPWITTDQPDGARAGGIAATICMPTLRAGRLAGLLGVHSSVPRQWSEAEQALVREVAERSWAHVERVRAEAALRDSERQLRLVLDGARIGTWQLDLVTGRGGWSPRTAEIMGLPHDRPLSQREQAAMIHPDDRARVQEGTARLAAAGTDFATEYRIVRPDGAVRWIASHGLIMRDAAGRPRRAIGTMRDVTARREAQEGLERLNRTLEAQVAERTAERDRMWRLSRDLLLVVDLRRRVRAVNPAVAALGYAEEAVLGRRLAAFVHPDDRLAADAAIRTVATAPIGEFAARLRAADGSWRHFIWSAAPGEGEAYVIGRDVTAEAGRREELEQAQEALRQAQKVESLGQLTGGVAHDFNNLLTPIIGNLDLLARRAGTDERQARMIRGALESAERARVLVQRLLAFARRQPLQPGPVDLAQLVGSMTALVASTVGPQVAVAAEVAPGLPPALADANQLELAVLNLAVNARDAMPRGGLLRLAAALASPEAIAGAGLAGDYLSLTVTDSGTGMDAGTAARAVEPFFSTKGVGKGTGLGLSMVHGLASQLGGAMLLTTAPGEGTAVELLLPLAAEAAAAAPEVEATPPGSGRVLLVDDEAAVRDATAEMLWSLGFDVAVAASGEEALAMLDPAPDYLVTDHLMPGIKGADLALLARARCPALKILVISGYAGLDEIPPELPRLAKPFRADELAQRLGALA